MGHTIKELYEKNNIKPPFGTCHCCDSPLSAEWFEDKEFYPNSNTPTGRIRTAVDHLYCPVCGEVYCIDDTFDGPWHY